MIFDNVLEMAKSVSHFTIAGEGNLSVRDGALSISGGMNSPWKVNMDSLKKFVESVDV